MHPRSCKCATKRASMKRLTETNLGFWKCTVFAHTVFYETVHTTVGWFKRFLYLYVVVVSGEGCKLDTLLFISITFTYYGQREANLGVKVASGSWHSLVSVHEIPLPRNPSNPFLLRGKNTLFIIQLSGTQHESLLAAPASSPFLR